MSACCSLNAIVQNCDDPEDQSEKNILWHHSEKAKFSDFRIEMAAFLITGIIFILILKMIFRWKGLTVISEIIEIPVKSDSVN